jgi:hypothetical protein
MKENILSPPQAHPIPPKRLSILRASIVSELSRGQLHNRPALKSPQRRNVVLVASVLTVLVAAGATVAMSLNFDFLNEQAQIDTSGVIPPAMRAKGARVEVTRGDDWSFMAWRSAEGYCVAYASTGLGNSKRSCGRVPQEAGGMSRYLVATLGVLGTNDSPAAFVGLIMPEVSRIEIELAGGRVISTDTREAPTELDTSLRTFLIRTQLREGPIRIGSGPRVRAYSSFAADGKLLERLTIG